MIRASNLTKKFKDLTAVDHLSFKIEKGDIFGFIGPNGAGKTTTIKMLATLLQPTAGSAEICNYSVQKNPDDVKRVIGYMPDFFGVYDDMKVWEYLDFFAAAYKIKKEKRKGIIDDVLTLTDLVAKSDTYVEALSRGMKQRLCLAKTLIHDPQVLLLDEPASGLDPRARIEMRELLKELRNMGKTVLISSHILTELSDFCNTVGIIEKGRLLTSGNIQEITDRMKGDRIIDITLAESQDPGVVHDLLISHDDVHNVLMDGGDVEVQIADKCEDPSFVLGILAENKIRIKGFKEREIDLEDIFMKITEGSVQ